MKIIFYVFALLILACPPILAGEQIKLTTVFNEDGGMNLPLNYRQWVNVGTTLIPKGEVNIIDNMPIKTNEFIDTYVEPMSYAIYMATGKWPNGTQIVKEFTAIKNSKPGEAMTESHYNGLSLLVKDTERFPKKAGYLGYFHFGHQKQPYKPKSKLMPREKCSFCHEQLASDQQYIFTDHHIGLNRSLLLQKKLNKVR
jgi:hypothetical protein